MFADRSLPRRRRFRLIAASLAAIVSPLCAGAQKPEGASAVRAERVAQLERASIDAREEAVTRARQRGWNTQAMAPGGITPVLHGLGRSGRPEYFAPLILNAGISTATNLVRDDLGGLTLLDGVTSPTLNGAGYAVGIWDEGVAYPFHPEFLGRVVSPDGTVSPSAHTGIVAGMIGATGVNPAAIGMAPLVSLHCYTSTNDFAEMTLDGRAERLAAAQLLISNHSYSRIYCGWQRAALANPTFARYWFGVWGELEDRSFGSYNDASVTLDQIACDTPYFLPFWAAGNDRSGSSSGGSPSAGETFYRWDETLEDWVTDVYSSSIHPLADRDANAQGAGYDTLIPSACDKNVLTVGAVNDAVDMPGGVRVPANGTSASFSGWGPTDDGRIKPDLVGNGTGVFGPTIAGYGSGSGTSYSTPNVAGSAVILQQYLGQLVPGGVMRASAMKALLLHTATDIGNAGPDYIYGWGLLDTLAAAKLLEASVKAPELHNTLDWRLIEGSVAMLELEVESDGTSPLRATIAWTDPPGPSIDALDDPTPRLVNDLDLRIEGPGGPYLPWRLNPDAPADLATTGDNVVDNVEQVGVDAPAAGTYTVRVTYKGTLVGGEQWVSLVVDGQTSALLSVRDWASY